MIDGNYDVVFRGQIVKTLAISAVQANLVKLFNSTPEAVARLFTGNEVVIRKSINYTDAMKYQSALKAAGALALIKEVEVQQNTAVPKSQTEEKPEPQAEPVVSSAQNDSPDDDHAAKDSGLSIAAVGAQILPEKVYQKKEVDTSAFSLAQVGERILPKKEPKIYQQPSIDHLSLEDK
jgi:hypothetical protein